MNISRCFLGIAENVRKISIRETVFVHFLPAGFCGNHSADGRACHGAFRPQARGAGLSRLSDGHKERSMCDCLRGLVLFDARKSAGYKTNHSDSLDPAEQVGQA